MIHLVSDFHGNVDIFEENMHRCPRFCNNVFLLGDMGFGFPEFDKERFYRLLRKRYSDKQFYLIQGNHDFLGEMDDSDNVKIVTAETWHKFTCINNLNILMIPGAYSYDKNQRIPDVSWWYTEEMSYAALENLLQVWKMADVIISHDAPLSSYFYFFPETKISRTNAALDAILVDLIKYEKPIHWFHGHLHYGYHQTIGNLQLIGVRQDSSFTVF